MRKPYELRSIESSDLIGTYSDLQSALDVIREEMAAHGDGRLQSVAVAKTNLRGDIRPIAVGPDLIALALSEPSGSRLGRRARPRRGGVAVSATRGRVARRPKAAV